MDNKESSINFVKEYAYDNDITIEKCTYSYSLLLEVIQTINTNLDELMQREIIISEMYEDVYSNSVKIGVHDLDKEKEKVIRSIIDKPYMDIFEKQISAEKCIDVKGGRFYSK